MKCQHLDWFGICNVLQIDKCFNVGFEWHNGQRVNFTLVNWLLECCVRLIIINTIS